MKRWTPPIIKIIEALWAVADDRITIEPSQAQSLFADLISVIKAKVSSSSGWKEYSVEYDESKNAIMANDSASYRQWYLSYPWIALLLKLGKLPLDEAFSNSLKGVKRKDINTKNKGSDGKEKVLEWVDEFVSTQGINLDEFHNYVQSLLVIIESMSLELLGSKKIPPKWY